MQSRSTIFSILNLAIASQKPKKKAAAKSTGRPVSVLQAVLREVVSLRNEAADRISIDDRETANETRPTRSGIESGERERRKATSSDLLLKSIHKSWRETGSSERESGKRRRRRK